MVSFVISSWARQNFFPLKGVKEYHKVVRDTRKNIIGGGGDGHKRRSDVSLSRKHQSKSMLRTSQNCSGKRLKTKKKHESKGFINTFTTPLSYRPLSIN